MPNLLSSLLHRLPGARPLRGRMARTLAARLPANATDTLHLSSQEAVFELGVCTHERQPEQLLEHLAALCLPGTELLMARHSRPEAPANPAPSPEDKTANEATRRRALLALVGPAQRVSTYLFVRTPADGPGTDELGERIEQTLRRCGWPARRVAGEALAELWHAWLPVPHTGEAVSQHAFVGRALGRAVHPLQWQGTPDPVLRAVERLQALHLRLGAGPLGALDARPGFEALVVELVRGAPSALPGARERIARDLRASNIAIESERLEEGLSCGLPWLLEQGEVWRRPLARHLLAMPVARAAALLPVSAGVALPPALSSAVPRTGALVVRKAAGEHVGLDARGPGLSPHVLILGSAGAGNTYHAHAMLASHLDAGGHAWVMRWMEEPLFDALHGIESHVLQPASPVSLNPLGGFETLEHLHDAMGPLRAWLVMLAELEVRELPGIETAWARHLLEDALVRAWHASHALLDVSGVLAALDAHERPEGPVLAARIRGRLQGLDVRWLQGMSPLVNRAASLSLDVQALARAPWGEMLCLTLLVLHGRCSFEQSRANPKMLVLDELSLIGRDGGTELLEQLMRRARPLGVQWVCTNAGFGARAEAQSPHERVLDAMSPFKLVLPGRLEHQQGWAARVVSEARERVLLGEVRLHAGRRSRSLWVDEARGGAELVELELPAPAHAVFGHDRAVLLAWKQARRKGLEPWAAFNTALANPRHVPGSGT